MDSRPRILFVDDEPHDLARIRLLLADRTDEWDVEFHSDAVAAMDSMATKPASVVVSDMRMPRVDGAEFLTRVRDLDPAIVRIVLSGDADEKRTERTLEVAHQWLTKECPHDELTTVVDGAVRAHELLRDPRVLEIIRRPGCVPPMPSSYQRVSACVRRLAFMAEDVARVLAVDSGLSDRILEFANSGDCGGDGQPIAGLRNAINYLGVREVSSFVLAMGVFDGLSDDAAVPGFCRADLERRSRELAVTVQRLLGLQDDGCGSSVGVLHDVGSVVLMRYDREAYARVAESVADRGVSIYDAELQVFGVSHAEVGAAVLAAWGLPARIVHWVGSHHNAEQWSHFDAESNAALLVAETLLLDGASQDRVRELLTECGLEACAERWLEVAR